jgi:hypothetical protein
MTVQLFVHDSERGAYLLFRQVHYLRQLWLKLCTRTGNRREIGRRRIWRRKKQQLVLLLLPNPTTPVDSRRKRKTSRSNLRPFLLTVRFSTRILPSLPVHFATLLPSRGGSIPRFYSAVSATPDDSGSSPLLLLLCAALRMRPIGSLTNDSRNGVLTGVGGSCRSFFLLLRICCYRVTVYHSHYK